MILLPMLRACSRYRQTLCVEECSARKHHTRLVGHARNPTKLVWEYIQPDITLLRHVTYLVGHGILGLQQVESHTVSRIVGVARVVLRRRYLFIGHY